jgi:hypothetical protein
MLNLSLLEWPRWAQMWALAFTLYFGCKWLTWQHAAVRNVALWRHPAYLLAWPGMDAAGFLADAPASDLPSLKSIEWSAAIAKLTLGLGLMFGVARLIPESQLYFAGWIGGTGLVLFLHFGMFHLLSCGWRSFGIPTRQLMNRPLASASLADFWGRRWNTAFRDLTHRLVFRPSATRFGTRMGLLAAFLVSGVIHDLVISVPARGGYGGPTAFFVIQGVAVLIERSEFGRRGGLQSGISGRVFAAVILLAPAPLLFHRPFILGVIVPFMRALGAL